jgi:CBS domain-containing protein
MAASGDEICIVVNAENVVLGRVRVRALGGGDGPVAAVMDPGPSTFRPNVDLNEMRDYMRRHKLQEAIISTADGVLMGILSRRDAEERGASGGGRGRG